MQVTLYRARHPTMPANSIAATKNAKMPRRESMKLGFVVVRFGSVFLPLADVPSGLTHLRFRVAPNRTPAVVILKTLPRLP